MTGDLAGNQGHPDHGAWIHALGQATYEAARLAGTCFDILRVWDSKASVDLLRDDLGTLQRKLDKLNVATPNLPSLQSFLDALDPARETRNDLLHALPALDGLLRITKTGRHREFYTVASLEDASDEMLAASVIGNSALYNDGGAALKAWHAAGGS